MAASLAREGFDVCVLADKAPEALRVDGLLLMGSIASLRRTANAIEASRAGRPHVIAWIWEPLPPLALPPWARKLGEAISPSALRVTWAKPLLQVATAPVYAFIYWFGHDAQPSGQLEMQTLRSTLQTSAWLRRGIANGWIDDVAVSTEQKRRYLASDGVDSVFAPVGQQAAFGRDLGLGRDIDVLFIGDIKKRFRRRKLARLVAELRALGRRVEVRNDVWGEERTRLINRARIMLHIHNFPWDTPWMQIGRAHV